MAIIKPAKILAIGSHPDDVEFGCGGTLRKFVTCGHMVYLLVMTFGESGGRPSIRKNEQINSAKALGIKEVFWGKLKDTKISFFDNVIEIIEDAVKKVNPSFVFVHHGKDTHQDHRHINNCSVVATRNVENVLFYEGPTTVDFQPNVYVDIDEFIETKMKSLQCHKSQIMKTNIEHQSILTIAKATANFRGTQCKVPQAEAFASLRMFINL